MGDLPHLLSSLKNQGNTKIIPPRRIGVGNKTVIFTELCMTKHIDNIHTDITGLNQIVKG